MGRLGLISVLMWAVGTAAFVSLSWVLGAPSAMHSPEVVIYGVFFASIPAVIVFWLTCVPLLRSLDSRGLVRNRMTRNVACCVIACLAAAAALTMLPRTASGLFDRESLILHITYTIVGSGLGIGYTTVGRRSSFHPKNPPGAAS